MGKRIITLWRSDIEIDLKGVLKTLGKGTITHPCKIYIVKALTLTVAVFDSGASREVIKVK